MTRWTKREHHIYGRYGLHPVEYHRMLTTQNHACYICKEPFGAKTPNVDHHHDSDRVRKILCASCNKRVWAVESGTPESPHVRRRYDRAPYRAYIEEHDSG